MVGEGDAIALNPPDKNITAKALIRALIAFPQAAIDQMRDGVGLHLPEPYEIWNILNTASGKIGSPTDSQMAMIRATLQFYHHPDRTQRYYQDRLFSLWLAKDYIDRAARLL